MAAKPTSATALRRALRQRDAENARLRTRLAAAERAATSPPLGDLPAVVAQLPGLWEGVFVLDAQGALKWANERFLARAGRPLADLAGRHLDNLLGHNPLDAATRALMDANLAANSAFEFDLHDPSPGYADNWLRVRMQPLPQSTAERHFVGLVEDITLKKQAELALAASEKRYRELAEHVPGVLYRWRRNADSTFTTIYISPQLEEIFGVPPQAADRLAEFMHPDDLAGWHASVLALAPGNTEHWAFEGPHAGA